jgi:hypothetical protein
MKPDTSFATKTGHFYLLSTLTNSRLFVRNPDAGEITWSVQPSEIVQPKPLTVTAAHESNLALDLSDLFSKEWSEGDLARQVLDL